MQGVPSAYEHVFEASFGAEYAILALQSDENGCFYVVDNFTHIAAFQAINGDVSGRIVQMPPSGPSMDIGEIDGLAKKPIAIFRAEILFQNVGESQWTWKVLSPQFCQQFHPF